MHWRQRSAPGASAPRAPHEAAQAREARRRRAVREAVERLRGQDSTGVPDHARVAAETGLPLGLLLWAYPEVQDLLHV